MKRFIPVSLAVLLGLVSTTELTRDQLFLQSTFKASLSSEAKNLQKAYCLMYDDYTVFDIRALENDNEGGYQVSGTLFKNYNINFCRSFDIQEGNKNESTFVYSSNGLGDVVA